MLLPCPYCDAEVIEGADTCDACGQPLTESHLPIPATAVERALLSDRVRLFQGRQPMVVSPTMPKESDMQYHVCLRCPTSVAV